MLRWFSPLLVAAFVLATASAVFSEQYEATLFPDRSLRYRTAFGLATDDFDAFYQPRRMDRWVGARFASHLTQLAPAGEASLGYGYGATDGLSWSVIGGGGYRSLEINQMQQRFRASGSAESGVGRFSFDSGDDPRTVDESSAHALVSAALPVGGGAVSLSLQTRWNAETRNFAEPPPLLVVPTPGDQVESGGIRDASLDSGELFQASSFEVEPSETERRFQAAAVAGYGSVPQEGGWGWSVDLLAGVERNSQQTAVKSVRRAENPSGFSELTYESDSDTAGLSPLVGGAVTLQRKGRSTWWLDLGGEYVPGASVSGDRGSAVGRQNVEIDVGGVSRVYTLTEQRTSSQSGTVGERLIVTAGVRNRFEADPLLAIGWGLHATWSQRGDALDIVTQHRVVESFDANGDGRFDEDDTTIRAAGASEQTFTYDERLFQATLPLALLIRSPTDGALEYRLGSELRYRNAFVSRQNSLNSVVLPSGLRVDGDDTSTPTRYTNASIAAGAADEARLITVTTAFRAGLGYWFSPTAKVDVMLNAESSGDGFLDFDDRSLGVSALLAF